MTATLAPPASPSPAHAPPRASGAGRRLVAGFEAIESLPTLAESRNRLVDLAAKARLSNADVATAVEADVSLTLRVLRAANRRAGADRDKVASVSEAVEGLSAETVIEIAAQAPTIDFFHRSDRFGGDLERFRLHAVATQRATDLLRRELNFPDRDELMVSALLHDVGKLVLKAADDRYPARVSEDAGTPEERIGAERRELGLDHAVIGGVLARRWRLPKRIATVVELHHSDEATGDAAIIRLADMLVHYGRGAPISPAELLSAAERVGLGRDELRRLMYDLPYPDARPTRAEPCPLTSRELDVVRGLARGEVYKKIGDRLSLAPSTVRTHLHNAYRKLGVEDRAQAVLIASARGWI